jgi:NarL family two-component system response regulator LiaR
MRLIDPDDLTGREREVAMLIGQGKSNSEIATELVLSKRTVETHVSHILSKLGLSNRAQIMRWAIDHGLIQTRA